MRDSKRPKGRTGGVRRTRLRLTLLSAALVAAVALFVGQRSSGQEAKGARGIARAAEAAGSPAPGFERANWTSSPSPAPSRTVRAASRGGAGGATAVPDLNGMEMVFTVPEERR
jgi:hypothetical protein